jgi:hypothetical protein
VVSVVAAVNLVAIARSYRTLADVELLALYGSAATGATALIGLYGRFALLIGLAGLLMIGEGVLVAFNVDELADRLSRRGSRWSLVFPKRSARTWRLTGVCVALIGAFWTLALVAGA